MRETVSMLRSTPFFSSWTATSVERLYFWFERRKLGPEEDVVRQGDEADFCFIIRSGKCDVLVDIEPEPESSSSEEDSHSRGATAL